MKRFLAVSAASCVLLVAAGAGYPAFAQQADAPPALHGQVHDRGVKILAPVPAAPQQANPAAVVATPGPSAIQPVAAPLPAPVIKPCARPIAQPDMQVDAASDFRSMLAPRLVGGGRVVLDLTAPYRANKAPPAGLGPWLDAVRGSGGRVTVAQYCMASRGFGNWLHTLFAAKPAPPTRSYRAARYYDVVLHADALDQTVTQVEFVPRAGRSAS